MDVKRLDPLYLSTRQNGGGVVMICGCFSANRKPNLATIEKPLNSVGYCTLLEKILLIFAEEKYPGGLIFQQDSASIHTSNHTKQFFYDMDIDTMDWPARSSDLNPIENLWGDIVTKALKHFNNLMILKV